MNNHISTNFAPIIEEQVEDAVIICNYLNLKPLPSLL